MGGGVGCVKADWFSPYSPIPTVHTKEPAGTGTHGEAHVCFSYTVSAFSQFHCILQIKVLCS